MATLLDKLMALPPEVTPDEAVRALQPQNAWDRSDGNLPQHFLGRMVIIQCFDVRENTVDYFCDPGQGCVDDIEEAAHWDVEEACDWVSPTNPDYKYTLILVED